MGNRIAVLMTCYNRVDTTLECLRRLFAQEVPEGYSFDVWLVDDASPDKTGERVKATYPQINVIQGTGKLFWCKGMRLAWDKAAASYDYDFYLWLNDDTMLNEGALATVLNDWDASRSRPGIICGSFVDGEGSARICYSGFSRKELDSLGGKMDFGAPIAVEGEMCGNLLLVPRLIYKEVGPIFSFYHHGNGDYDYGIQVRKKGFVCYSASRVLGWCTANHGSFPDLKQVPFFKRITLLWDPKGVNIADAVVFRYRKDGLWRAFLTAGHVIVRVMIGTR